MSQIEIPERILDQFKDAAQQDHTETGYKSDSADSSAAGKGVEDLVTWAIQTGDTLIKRYDDRLGIDKELIDSYSELASLVARRNLSGSLLRWSPEAALAIASLSIVASNYLTLQEIQSQNEDKDSTTGEGAADEQ